MVMTHKDRLVVGVEISPVFSSVCAYARVDADPSSSNDGRVARRKKCCDLLDGSCLFYERKSGRKWVEGNGGDGYSHCEPRKLPSLRDAERKEPKVN